MTAHHCLPGIARCFWPHPSPSAPGIWALLDGARDPRVYPAVRDSSLEYTCLFGGELSPQWRAVAPYLVELSPSNPYTAYLLDLAWGNSWGVFMRVADATRLRLHLKTFLRAKLADGTRVMFRYYDPRVLRAYLPTCNIDELRTVFGPVNHYLIESGDGGEVIEFGLAGTQLSARRFAVNDAVEPASPEPASPC